MEERHRSIADRRLHMLYKVSEHVFACRGRVVRAKQDFFFMDHFILQRQVTYFIGPSL